MSARERDDAELKLYRILLRVALIVGAALLMFVCGCVPTRQMAHPLPPAPAITPTPAVPMFAAAGPSEAIPCIGRWGKPCQTNAYTGRWVLTWNEAAPVFEYGVYSSTDVRVPVALWLRFTNTTAHVIAITANDAQRFFYVRWTNTISKATGFVL